MKKLINILLGILSIIAVSTIASVRAEDVGFDIQAIKQENQIDKEKTYFDLRMIPNQEQTIEFMLNNSSEEAGRFSVTVAQAYTNESGFIDYRENDSNKDDETLKYPIDKMVEYDKEVSVPAESSMKIPIKIKMPEKQFDGQMWAAILVNKKFSKKEQEEKKGISNEYGYVLSLRLTETDNPIKRDLKLNKVEADVAFHKPAVVAYLQNPTMDAYGGLTYDAQVTNKKTNEVVIEKKYNADMQMAPNSTYPFSLEWDKKTMKPGEYNYNLVVSDTRGNIWKFTQDFTVTRDKIRKIDDLVIGNIAKRSKLWIIIVVAIITVLLLAIGVLLFLLKRRKNEDKEKNL